MIANVTDAMVVIREQEARITKLDKKIEQANLIIESFYASIDRLKIENAELIQNNNILKLQVSAKRETWISETIDRLEKQVKDLQKYNQEHQSLSTLQELEISRLKYQNEKLLFENDQVVASKATVMEHYSKLYDERDRLTASLAIAHEKLRESSGLIKMLDRDRKYSSLDEHLDKVKEILSEPSGSLALERWKKIQSLINAVLSWGSSDYESRSKADLELSKAIVEFEATNEK